MTVVEKMLRVALYIRVSTDEQLDGFSLPEQKRDLLAHAESKGWRVVEIVADEGHSGAVGVRPGLDRIMELAQAGEIDAVLAKKRNRLFRDRYLRMGYEKSLQQYGVRLLALDDAGHRFADAMMDEFGDWFREEVRKNTAAGRMEKARQGKLIAASQPIYGFAFTPDREGFVVVPERMEAVRRLIEAVATLGSIRGAVTLLRREGIPAPGGGPVWSHVTVRRTVLNDAYRPVPYAHLAPLLTEEAKARLDPDGEYGIVWYPKLKVEKLEPDPSRNYARPVRQTRYERSEQVPIPVVSSGIPAEVIDAAREAIRDNVRFRSTANRTFELGSIVRCEDCGNRLAATWKQDGPRTYFYYRCSNHQRHGSRVCSMNRNIPAEALERAVLRTVLDAVKDRDELIRKAQERYERERDRLLRSGRTDATGWRKALDEIERRRARAQRAYMEEAMGLEDLKARHAELDAEKGHVERLLAEHEALEERLEALREARDRAVGQIERGEWSELGITAPEARRERYREIGLSAAVAVDGTVRLSWGLGQEATIRTTELTSRGRSRGRCRRSRLNRRCG